MTIEKISLPFRIELSVLRRRATDLAEDLGGVVSDEGSSKLAVSLLDCLALWLERDENPKPERMRAINVWAAAVEDVESQIRKGELAEEEFKDATLRPAQDTLAKV